jgi:G3E family GTPase
LETGVCYFMDTLDGQDAPKIPVTLLTGFLGAGKTARLNATLEVAASDGQAKIAVIENELGALGVDGELVANTHDDGVIELTNGCLCCSAEVDLVDALESLARRRNTNPFGRVIIETTGLADVGPVVSLLRDPNDPLYHDFVFDGVVTIIDAAAFKKWASSALGGTQAGSISNDSGCPLTSWRSGFSGASPNIDALNHLPDIGLGRATALMAFWKQVALADQVVLSKIDLVEQQTIQDLCKVVASVCPMAQLVVDSSLKASPLPPPLGGHDVAMPQPPAGVTPRLCGTKRQRRSTGVHLEGITSVALSFPAENFCFHAERLRSVAANLLDGTVDGLGEVWRIKGIVVVEDMGPALVQGVGDDLTLESWMRGLKGDPFIVIIGEKLDKDQLDAVFAACQGVNAPQLDSTSPD